MAKNAISLQAAIALPLAVLAGTTVLLQALLQQQGVGQQVASEGDRLLSQIGVAAQARADRLLAAPAAVVAAAAAGIARRHLPAKTDSVGIADHLLAAMRASGADRGPLDAIVYIDERGTYAGYRRSGQLAGFTLMAGARHAGAASATAPDTDRAADAPPWADGAPRPTLPQWSPPHASGAEGKRSAVSLSVPGRERGRTLAVVVAEIALDDLNVALHEDGENLGGMIAILDANGLVVSHSASGGIIRVGTASRPLAGTPLTDSPEPVMRAAAQSLAALPHPGGKDFSFAHGGGNYHGRMVPYRGPQGIDWRILAVIPESALLARASEGQAAGFAVVGALGLIGLLLAIQAIARMAPRVRTSPDEPTDRSAPGAARRRSRNSSPAINRSSTSPAAIWWRSNCCRAGAIRAVPDWRRPNPWPPARTPS
jgi:hypothetical protein